MFMLIDQSNLAHRAPGSGADVIARVIREQAVACLSTLQVHAMWAVYRLPEFVSQCWFRGMTPEVATTTLDTNGFSGLIMPCPRALAPISGRPSGLGAQKEWNKESR
jgi:hypothetical protein